MSQSYVFPIQAPSVDVDAVSTDIFGPPGNPRGAVARGRRTDTGEWFASIAYERPTLWRELNARKEDRELTCLHRFMRDYERHTNSAFGESPRRGADPPDFVLERPSGTAGVELTQLVYQERIEAWKSVSFLKRKLPGIKRDTFRHLHGLCVYVSYGAAGAPTADRRALNELVDALRRFRPASIPKLEPHDHSSSRATQIDRWT